MTAAALLRPALVDGMLALLAVETSWLVRRARRGEGGAARDALSFAAAGAALLIAIRGLLAGWPAWSVLAALAVAGVGNVLHVAAAATRPP